MVRLFHAQNGRSGPPGVANILSRAQKLIVIPVPILRNCRRRKGESGVMKSHPRAAVFHVLLKRLPLRRSFRARVQKKNNLISRKKGGIQIVPVRRRLVVKMIFRRHLREPLVGLVDETDMCRVLLPGVKGNHFELRGRTLRGAIPGGQPDSAERNDSQRASESPFQCRIEISDKFHAECGSHCSLQRQSSSLPVTAKSAVKSISSGSPHSPVMPLHLPPGG